MNRITDAMINLLAASEVRTREILRWLRDSRIYPETFKPDHVFLTPAGRMLKLADLSGPEPELLWVPSILQLMEELLERGWVLALRRLDTNTWIGVLTRKNEKGFYLEGVGHDEEHAMLSVLERWKALLVVELLGDAAK